MGITINGIHSIPITPLTDVRLMGLSYIPLINPPYVPQRKWLETVRGLQNSVST